MRPAVSIHGVTKFSISLILDNNKVYGSNDTSMPLLFLLFASLISCCVKKFQILFNVSVTFFLQFTHACEKKSTKKVAYPVFSLYLCTRNEIEVGFCEIPNWLSKAVFQ